MRKRRKWPMWRKRQKNKNYVFVPDRFKPGWRRQDQDKP